VSWFRDHDAARLAAVTGHVLLRAGDSAAGRWLANAAAQLGPLGPAARRTLMLCLLDEAHAELLAGSSGTALTTATRAAALIERTPYALGITYLRAFRDALGSQMSNGEAIRMLDKCIAYLAA